MQVSVYNKNKLYDKKKIPIGYTLGGREKKRKKEKGKRKKEKTNKQVEIREALQEVNSTKNSPTQHSCKRTMFWRGTYVRYNI